jgi:hypothetical protein
MAEASNHALFVSCFPDLSCMHRGVADTECKLYDDELLGRYINVTSGCEYGSSMAVVLFIDGFCLTSTDTKT